MDRRMDRFSSVLALRAAHSVLIYIVLAFVFEEIRLQHILSQLCGSEPLCAQWYLCFPVEIRHNVQQPTLQKHEPTL